MTRPAPIAAVLTASLLMGLAPLAHGQSAPPLKGTLDAETPAVDGKLATTTLEIEPLEPVQQPRRRLAAEDPYAPTGIGTGGLRLYPSITVGGVYTSNATSSNANPKADGGLQLKPSLRFESDWVRHSWTGGVNGSLTFYASNNDLNAHSLDAFQRLRLDVRRSTQLELGSSYALDQSGIGASDVPATAKGYRTEHTLAASAALTHDFGPMSGALKSGLTGRIFEDVKLNGGGVEDNRDRNYVEPSLALRATYTDPPVLKPYVEASYAPRLHTTSQDRNGLSRNSQGFGLTAGVELDAGPIWAGDLGLTYLHRNYEDAALDNVDTVGLTGNMTWSPTELTRVVMSAGTSISETTSATVSGNPLWTASVAVSHAMRDNVDIFAGAGIEIEDIGSSVDRTYDANLGLSWKFNPVLSWTAAYDFTWLDAGTPGRSYQDHRVSTGLTLSR